MRLVVTWVGLVLATLVSVWVGGGHGSVVGPRLAVALVLVVAFVKICFVGAEFMELRAAPRWLRLGFAGWVVVVGLVTTILAAWA